MPIALAARDASVHSDRSRVQGQQPQPREGHLQPPPPGQRPGPLAPCPIVAPVEESGDPNGGSGQVWPSYCEVGRGGQKRVHAETLELV